MVCRALALLKSTVVTVSHSLNAYLAIVVTLASITIVVAVPQHADVESIVQVIELV
jgi:hypothetical protein